MYRNLLKRLCLISFGLYRNKKRLHQCNLFLFLYMLWQLKKYIVVPVVTAIWKADPGW